MRKSDDIAVHWQGKESVQKENNKWTETKLLKFSGAIGTYLLQDYTSYWEVDISFHLRGIKKDSHAVCCGICAYHKLESIGNMAHNYFFYGIAWGKGENGTPDMDCVDEGVCEKNITMRPARHYFFNVGFLYNAVNAKLSMINIKQNQLVYTTRKLKGRMGSKCIYVPVFDTDSSKNCEISMKYRTGMDIPEIPSCVSQLL